MAEQLLHHLLEHSAARSPEAVALIEGTRQTCYRELAEGAARLAQLLQAQGVAPGDRVALLAANSRFYVEGYFAALQAGAVVVPINTALPAAGLAGTLQRAGARVLLCGASLMRPLRRADQALTSLDLLITEGKARLPGLPAGLEQICADEVPPAMPTAPVPRQPDDLAAIVFTSGSTGTPLGVALSHRNLLSNTRAILAYLPIDASERAFVVLPFHYIYGSSVLNTHLAVGATLVLENSFMFLQAALDRLEAEACTSLAGVPSTFALLLHRSSFARRPLAQLRYLTQAGGAMSPALTRQLCEALRGRELYVMYGATEAAGRLSYLPPAELDAELGSIGRAIDGVELRVLRPDGSEAATDEVGELVARGDSVMQGYWQEPEETARVLDERGLHTGDLGYRNARGVFYVVGRSKDMIKSGAHRIAAREIEHAILEHPEVHEVAVLGVADPLLGEAIHAYLVPQQEDLAGDVLRTFLATRLADYKIPGVIVNRAALPKNSAGKILKQQLREELGLPS